VDLDRERRIRRTLDELADKLKADPELAARTTDYLEGENMKEQPTKAPDAPERLATLTEVADYLAVTRRHVYRLIDERGLPAFKMGTLWRVRWSDLDAWLKRQATGGKQGR